LLVRLGHEPLDPWTLTDQSKIDAVLKNTYGPRKRAAWRVLNVEIGGNNRAAIDHCDLVFAVLDGRMSIAGPPPKSAYCVRQGQAHHRLPWRLPPFG